MNKLMLSLTVVTLVNTFPMLSLASTIDAGSAIYRYENSFFVRLSPGTPFNPGPDSVDVPVVAQGKFTQEWDAQSGDVILDELTSVRATGAILALPQPIPFELFAGAGELSAFPVAPGSDQLQPFLGSLTSVVNDPGTGELISAFRSVEGSFVQVLASGAVAYSVDPYQFVASVDSLPFGVSDLFIGTRDVDLFLQVGTEIDTTVDLPIGQVLAGGIIEITRVVPEPSTAMVGMLVLAAFALVRSRSLVDLRE